MTLNAHSLAEGDKHVMKLPKNPVRVHDKRYKKQAIIKGPSPPPRSGCKHGLHIEIEFKMSYLRITHI